jgi:phosphoenolpyruvate carboxykinase (ATP)
MLCSDPNYRLNVRVITETPANLFCYNMFAEAAELAFTRMDCTFVPSFMADPAIDGTRVKAICIRLKVVLIGGTGYTGEMKKKFLALNFILPVFKIHYLCTVAPM